MTEHYKDLLKVLIGVAWIDGEISEAENFYLTGLAYKANLSTDPEIQELLSFERPVSFDECLKLVATYLEEERSEESYNEMVKSIRALVQADGVVAVEENEFLHISKFLRLGIEDAALEAKIEQCHNLEEVISLAQASGYEIQPESLKEVRAQVEMEQKMQLVAAAYLDGDEKVYQEDMQAMSDLIKSVLGYELKFRVESVWAPVQVELDTALPQPSESPSLASQTAKQLPAKPLDKKFWQFWK